MEEQGYITTAEYREARDQRPRPQPRRQVPGDPRPLPLRPRPAGADRQLRDQHRPQRRPQGLHDDRPRTAGNGRGSGRTACYVCYPEGGPAAGLASVNPDNGEIVALASTEGYATRRPVQLRLAGAPPARLLVQDLRPDDRDQAGHRPRHDLLRRHLADDPGAPRRRHLDGQQRRARRRRDVARPARPCTRSTSSSPSSTSTSAPKT